MPSCINRPLLDAQPDDDALAGKYTALMRKALAHIENTVQNLVNFLRQKKIEVESEEGKGTAIRLRFPILDEKAVGEKARICAAVLAGGKSSRMGKNKALLSLNGKSLIEHAVGAILTVTDFVQVITNTPKDYAFLKLPMLADEIKNIGPLGGIYTALKHCKTRQCLIIACDLPFLSIELMRFLCENAGTADIFAIDAGKGVEPLCAVYSTRCLPAIEAQIAKKDYKVAHVFEQVDARVVRFHPGHSLYAANLFYNVNTPEDFEKAGFMQISFSFEKKI